MIPNCAARAVTAAPAAAPRTLAVSASTMPPLAASRKISPAVRSGY
jgi:hypothetical protein